MPTPEWSTVCRHSAVASEAEPLRVGVIGAGRIGALHAEIIASQVPGLRLAAVADVHPSAAEVVARRHGAPALSVADVIGSPDVDAVAVCSSTDSHVDMIVAAAQAGKGVFCEKPISLDAEAVARALAAVDSAGVPFMVGFNRRFDPAHSSVRRAVADGTVGEVHLVRITSRDPYPPPVDYVNVSGGIFVDMMIHDFDMARFITDSPVVEVFARGAVLIDPEIGAAGDFDTATAHLTHANGAMTMIDNSRKAVYGYDQRIEAFGSAGMAASENVPLHTGVTLSERGLVTQPLQPFFLQRYAEAYRREWEAFDTYVRGGGPSPASGEDGRIALELGEAATESARTGLPVRVGET